MNNNILNQTNGFGVSNKYRAIPTQSVIDYFESKGFNTRDIVETSTSIKGKEGFQKHMIKLNHPDFAFKGVNDSIPEIVIVNSYDGRSSLKVMLGVYRLVCSNGLVIGKNCEEYRIRHLGDFRPKLDQAMESVIDTFPRIAADLDKFNHYEMQLDEVKKLALDAAHLALPEGFVDVSFNRLLRVRRIGDKGSTLWHVFNRLQENILHGGIKYLIDKPNKDGILERKLKTSRRIKSIDRQVAINRQLWDLASQYAA